MDDKQKRRRKRNKNLSSQEFQIPEKVKKTLPPTVNVELEVEYIMKNMFGAELGNILLPEQVIEEAENTKTEDETINEDNVYNLQHNMYKSLQDSSDEEDKSFFKYNTLHETTHNSPRNSEHENDSLDIKLTKPKRPINKPDDLGERIQKKVYHEDDEFERGGPVLPLNSDSEEYSPAVYVLQDINKDFSEQTPREKDRNNAPSNTEHANDSPDMNLTKSKRPINKPNDLGERIQKKVYHEDDEFKRGGSVLPLNSDSEEYSNEDDEFERGGPVLPLNMYKSLQDSSDEEDKSFFKYNTLHETTHNSPRNIEHENDSLDIKLTKPKRPINKPDDLGERIQKKVYHEDDEFKKGGPVQPLNSDSEEYSPAVYVLQDINEDFSEQTTQEKDRNNAPSNTEHDNDSLDMNLTKPKRPINRPDDLGERIQKKVYHEDDEFERGGPVLPLNSDSEEYIPAVYGLQDINEDFSEQTTQEKDRNTEAKYRKDDHIPAFSDNNDPSDSSEEHCEIECPSKFSIKISKQTWETIKPKEKQYALSGKWTDVLSKEFYKINSSCVLAFKYNRVKKMGSRKKTTPYFKGKAYCGHAKGTMYEFTIRKKPKDSKEFIKIKVQTHGNCVHKEQVVKKRKLTGKQRTEIGKRLETEGASNVHYTLMADMPNEAIEHGNFTECLTKKVLQEVLYEIRQKEKFAKEDIADVLLTKNAMSDLDETSKKIKGYIQSVGADPFSIICYTEEQIRLMKRLKKNGTLVIYLDATGKVVRKIQNQTKKPFYYAACVKSPVKGEPSMPVAEMVTNDHTSVSIASFALKLRHATSIVFGRPIVPDRVESDFSWPIINASLAAFCGQNIKQYLNSMWGLLRRENTNEERRDTCIIHLCCSHIIKKIRDKMSDLTKDKQLGKFILYCFALLQNATKLEKAKLTFKHIKNVLTSPTLTKKVEGGISYLNLNIESSIESQVEKDTEGEGGDFVIDFDEDDQLVSLSTIRKSSPFSDYFFKQEGEIELDETNEQPNPYYLPPALLYIETYMPIFPLWSGVVVSITEGITRDSNCHVENWFKIMKKDTLQGKKRLAPGNFIRRIYQVLKGRIKGFSKTVGSGKIKTTKKAVGHNIELQEEIWKKREESNIRSYYISPSKAPEPKKAKQVCKRNNGLKNVKNNCWLNSSLQALKMCTKISSCSYDDSKDVLRNVVLKKIALLNTKTTQPTVYSITDILKSFTLNVELKDLANGRQHDPSIFLAYFLETLKEFVPCVLRYDHHCLRCNREFVGREEKTLILSVELVHQELKPSVQKMVNEYLKTETLTDENMLHCKIKTPFERITRVIQTPSTLIIQLKRFTNDLEKVTDTIKVDRIISIDEAQYTLRSVQIHSGNFLMHGHYYTLTLEEEKIVCYNDELVNIEDKGIMTNTSIQNNAYILYYEQTDSHCVENLETDPVIGKIGSLLLYESNLECLDDGRWLNDQVINAYLAIIQRDHRDLVLCLDTFFLIEKKHDLKSIKSINTVDMVLIPVPSNNHWSLLVVQSKNQTVFVLDSSGVINMKAVEFIRSLYKKEFSIDLSYTKKLKHKISLQENGYDCGVFVLLYSEALAGGQTLCFTKNEIATARQRIRQRIMKAVIK